MEAGELVSDAIVSALIGERLDQADTAGGVFETEANTDSVSFTHVVRCRIAGTDYYIGLNTSMKVADNI